MAAALQTRHNRTKRLGLDARVLLTAIPLLCWAGVALAAQTLPSGVTPEMVRQGDTIFHDRGRCFKCHGPDGKGTQKGPNLTPPKKWINIRGDYPEIVDVVTKGIPEPKEHSAPMPSRAKAGLSDEEVHAVAAYAWTLSH